MCATRAIFRILEAPSSVDVARYLQRLLAAKLFTEILSRFILIRQSIIRGKSMMGAYIIVSNMPLSS